jgi:hypothetical protein
MVRSDLITRINYLNQLLLQSGDLKLTQDTITEQTERRDVLLGQLKALDERGESVCDCGKEGTLTRKEIGHPTIQIDTICSCGRITKSEFL